MSSKPIKVPDADHPIAIEPNTARIVVKAGGRVIADSARTLTLREAGYRPVHYFPRADVYMHALVRTQHQTYCPYKGDCSYYSIAATGEQGVNAVWTYETPYAAVAEIKDYVAIYPNRVDSIEETTVG